MEKTLGYGYGLREGREDKEKDSMFGTLSTALHLCHQANTEEKEKLCGTETKRILLLTILRNEFLFHIFAGSLKILNNLYFDHIYHPPLVLSGSTLPS